MPSRAVHELLDRLLLGKACRRVHKLMDSPSKLLGRKHRVLFHDPLTAAVLGYAAGGLRGAASALLHVVLDEGFKPRRVKRA